MDALFPIPCDTGWGYMNIRCDVVVPPEHESARPFFEGYGAARKDGRYAFFDHRGSRVSDYEFEDVRAFSDELCAVKKDGIWRYLDRKFRERFAIPHRSCGDFSDGLALVYHSALNYHYIDRRGTIVIRSNNTMGQCSQGLLAFKASLKSKVGFKDRTGAWSIRPSFLAAGDFAEGIAIAKTAEAPRPRHSFISVTGQELLTTDWDFLVPQFSEGLVAFVDPRRELSGFLSKDGEVAVAPEYDVTERYSEGLALVTRGERSCFIDQQGATRIDIGTASAASFRHGLAWVASKSTFAYYDREGNRVWRSSKRAREIERTGVRIVLERYREKAQQGARATR